MQGKQPQVVGPPKAPHIPGLVHLGLDERHLVWIHADKPVERLWAIEQLLRANAAGMVLGWVPQARQEQIRRLQNNIDPVTGKRAYHRRVVLVEPEPEIIQPEPVREKHSSDEEVSDNHSNTSAVESENEVKHSQVEVDVQSEHDESATLRHFSDTSENEVNSSEEVAVKTKRGRPSNAARAQNKVDAKNAKKQAAAQNSTQNTPKTDSKREDKRRLSLRSQSHSNSSDNGDSSESESESEEEKNETAPVKKSNRGGARVKGVFKNGPKPVTKKSQQSSQSADEIGGVGRRHSSRLPVNVHVEEEESALKAANRARYLKYKESKEGEKHSSAEGSESDKQVEVAENSPVRRKRGRPAAKKSGTTSSASSGEGSVPLTAAQIRANNIKALAALLPSTAKKARVSTGAPTVTTSNKDTKKDS
eukprot:gene38728-47829_t